MRLKPSRMESMYVARSHYLVFPHHCEKRMTDEYSKMKSTYPDGTIDAQLLLKHPSSSL